VSAKESLASSMDLEVLVEIGFLCEGKLASVIMTNIWPFFCVDSQMIIEVMPFPKYFPAV